MNALKNTLFPYGFISLDELAIKLKINVLEQKRR